MTVDKGMWKFKKVLTFSLIEGFWIIIPCSFIVGKLCFTVSILWWLLETSVCILTCQSPDSLHSTFILGTMYGLQNTSLHLSFTWFMLLLLCILIFPFRILLHVIIYAACRYTPINVPLPFWHLGPYRLLFG